MTRRFVEFLNETKPGPEKVLIALRFYLAELTEDKLPRELVAEIEKSVGNGERVQEAQRRLEGDRRGQLQIALAFFGEQWEDAGERDRIVRAFDGASTRLPVIEAGLISIVAMYAMYLIATGGRVEVKRRVVHRPDGSFEEEVVEKMFEPTGPLQAVVSLFSGLFGPKAD